jgi:hypothetical protein
VVLESQITYNFFLPHLILNLPFFHFIVLEETSDQANVLIINKPETDDIPGKYLNITTTTTQKF